MRLSGQVALITGAARRMGASEAKLFARHGARQFSAYHASKGAVRVLTKQAAVEYVPEGIRVNSIHPGYIDTAMLRAPFEGQPEELEKIIAAVTPMERVGTAEEIANAALFLACDEASFMTGAEMVVDGGYTAR